MAIPILPLLRCLLCPTVYTLILIQHARNPNRLPAKLPKLWPVTRSTTHSNRPIPVSLLASFRLGRLVQRLQTDSPISNEQQILAQAREYLTRDIASLDELDHLEADLEHIPNRLSLTRRLRTALTFANLLWIVSIAGLGVTFWPTLKLVFGTLLAMASEWFMRVMFPLLVRLHRIGVFEALSYVVCILLVAQAARYLHVFGAGVPGSYVALTAFVASILAFWYTMHLHFDGFINVTDPMEGTTMGVEDLSGLLWAIFQVCVLVPLGAVHQSQLLGFIGALAIMNVLGYTVRNLPYNFIGFHTSETADHLTLSSGILVAIFVAVRLLGSAKYRWMKPLHLGVMILGNVGYFTGLLVRASKDYHEGVIRDGLAYVLAQIHMVVSLAAAIGLGKLFAIVSLSSTGIVYGSLYVIEKLYELPWGNWIVVAWFGFFGLLYAVAGYLRTHPELLKNIAQGRGLLSGSEEND